MPITLDIAVETIHLIKKASHHTENQYFTTFDSVYYNLQCARTADTALVDSLNCHPLGVLSFSYFWALLNIARVRDNKDCSHFSLTRRAQITNKRAGSTRRAGSGCGI